GGQGTAGVGATPLAAASGPPVVPATPLREAWTADVRPAVIVMLIAVALLMATAAANVAGIQLARATVRRHEMAIRSAIGAGSLRIARQLLVENAIVALRGGFAD